ncbi:MAG: hypothetical protein VX246_01595 [Myxococcota bacterium]|nr:hypothetical protein [Myxococcota bacterium]
MSGRPSLLDPTAPAARPTIGPVPYPDRLESLGVWAVFFADPDGSCLELIEAPVVNKS